MSISGDFRMMPLTNRTSEAKAGDFKISDEDLQGLIDAGWKIQKPGEAGLNTNDFLQLIVQQFKNQSIDETASTTDMINQMVQMSVIQAITGVMNSIATMVDASTLTYASSLVGKEVTVGKYDDKGKLQEVVGTVTGTGTYKGLPVIFVNGEQYYLNEILAVGRVPEKPDKPGPDKPGGGDGGNGGGGDSGNGGENTKPV